MVSRQQVARTGDWTLMKSVQGVSLLIGRRGPRAFPGELRPCYMRVPEPSERIDSLAAALRRRRSSVTSDVVFVTEAKGRGQHRPRRRGAVPGMVPPPAPRLRHGPERQGPAMSVTRRRTLHQNTVER
jgi:hypothetical protein